MTNLLKWIALSLCLACPLAVFAQSAPDSKRADSAKPESTLLGELWGKLRSYGPRLQAAGSSRQASITVGIRGAENTESELKPYWKDDRANDPAFADEAKAYRTAQELAEKNRMREAAQAFDGFIKTYPNSPFKPNAQFALGLSHGALGEKVQATTALKTFVKDYPKHPLVDDANRALEQISKL